MNSIDLIKLHKSYDGLVALKELDLSVKKGEVYGFIGKNGAGKTTTINLILSLVHKTSGKILIDEKEVVFTDQMYKSKIGYVPDVPVFPSYMNAKEYLIYTLDIYGLKEDQEQRAKEILDFVSLEDNKKKISGYSRGMKQRLAIGQALIHDPDILIMDEPTSALDPIGRMDVMNIILELKGKKTIFYSTHILDDVEKVCDRIGILNKGELILEDSIENLLERFNSRRVYIETLSSSENLIKVIKKLKMIDAYQPGGKGVNVKIKEGFNSTSILTELISNGEEIVEFRQVKPSIEDVFIEEISK